MTGAGIWRIRATGNRAATLSIPSVRTAWLVRWLLATAALVPMFYVSWILSGGRAPWAAHAYYLADLAQLYAIREEGAVDAFVYSPAFAQVMAPLTAIFSWPAFQLLWTAANVAALVWLVGPWLGLACLIPVSPVVDQIAGGNINLFIAAVVVAGFRAPALWAFVLLTKVTPGVGLLWFAVRRDWRALATCALATLAIVGVSAVLAPGLWPEWFALLRHNASGGTFSAAISFRLAIAAALVAYGAWRNRPVTVAIAAVLALPVIWWSGWSILTALPRLIYPERFRPTGSPPASRAAESPMPRPGPASGSR